MENPMAELLVLAENWEQLARNKFRSAQEESDPMGRRLIEHGATCYFNCAQQLRKSVQPDAVVDLDLQVFNQDAERP